MAEVAAPWCFKLKLLFQLPAGNGPRANIQLTINIFTIHPCLQDQLRKKVEILTNRLSCKYLQCSVSQGPDKVFGKKCFDTLVSKTHMGQSV